MQQRNGWMLLVWVLPLLSLSECSWGSPGSGQYHIQTDEGPERYFRFQTDNGQFRKEKRLQDGTVIGTEAWIDAAGFLRQKDYIADKEGYRILKSKTIFVGQGRQIEDAIKSTKSVPAQSGVLVDGRHGLRGRINSVDHTPSIKQNGYVYSTTPITISSTTTTTTPAPELASAFGPGGKLSYLSPAEAANIEPSPYLGFDHYPDEMLLPPPLPHSRKHHQPLVHIRPNSEPIEQHDNSIADDYTHHVSSTTERTHAQVTPSEPSVSMEPPFASNYRRIRPIAVVASTPAPIAANEAVSARFSSYSTPAPFLAPTSSTPSARGYQYTPAQAYAGTDDETYGVPSYSTTTARPIVPLDINNLDGLLPPLPPSSSPHYRRLRIQPYNSNSLGSDDYDGVANTRNGFRYYLPHQYHEEEQIDERKRAGSFGYVDPFGIRRVVYYNASPGRGFVHRNNNQYVGLGATPYDHPGPRSSGTAIRYEE